MGKAKKPPQKFMKYAGCIVGPPDLSSRRGFERDAYDWPESVYLLYHLHKEKQAGDTILLLIGAYRSKDEARTAIKRLKKKPGFSTHPDGFGYHPYQLGVDNWSDGF
jgi:hypothetical protein